MTKPLNPVDYLDLFKISDYKYLIGIFENGITFYKQQIRALNIFDALKKSEQLPENKDYTISIIGGGIAGLTFAAAALKSGYKVVLLEKGSQTLNIQAKCNIRDIHPYMYDWPGKNSTQTRTNLPVLNWHHDTAANVVQFIKKEFGKIVSVANDLVPGSYVEYCHVKEVEIKDRASGKRFEINGSTYSRYGAENIHRHTDMIIYAIGYGIEKRISDENKSESYWRDISIKQDDLSRCNYVIQGTGDGALIDLFCILIRDFSYDSFLNILHGDEQGKVLLQRLVKIQEKRIKSDIYIEDLYETEFMKIPASEFQYILEAYNKRKLFTKLDPSVNVYLFGLKENFYRILDYRKISFINAFIAYILFESKKFLYDKDLDPSGPLYKGKSISKPIKTIIRLGTDRDKVIKEAIFTADEEEQIKTLEKLQAKSAAHGLVKPHWKKDDFNKYFNEVGRLHHLSKKTKSLCSVFIDILGGSLFEFYDENKDLRVTMHRVLSIDGELYYQMMTPYAPQLQLSKKGDGKAGTIYEIDEGNVGYTIKSGKPLWVKNINQEAFDNLMILFKKDFKHTAGTSAKTILTIPILASYKGKKSGTVEPYRSTNAVIYMSSSDVNFFDDPEVQNMILRLCETFINTLNLSLKNEDLEMADVDFDPPKCIRTKKINNECAMALESFEDLLKRRHSLKIDQYCSFEMLPWN